jgi:hypothetical protein
MNEMYHGVIEVLYKLWYLQLETKLGLLEHSLPCHHRWDTLLKYLITTIHGL